MKRSEITNGAELFFSRARKPSMYSNQRVRVLDAEGRYRERHGYISSREPELCVQVDNPRVLGVKVVRLVDGEPSGRPFCALPQQLHGDYDTKMAELTAQADTASRIRSQQMRLREVQSNARAEVVAAADDLGLTVQPGTGVDRVELTVQQLQAVVTALTEAGWTYPASAGIAYDELLEAHHKLLGAR